MRILLGVTVLLMHAVCSGQSLPDSLIARVVLLERIAYETEEGNWNQPKYPQATGFFMSLGSSALRYLVTAKHALYRPDTVVATQIHAVGIEGKERDFLLTDYRTSRSVVQHEDSLVDLLLIDNNTGLSPQKFDPHSFRESDIVGKSELERLRRGLQVFYIERWPDSAGTGMGAYKMPQGVFLKAPPEPLRLLDPIRNFSFNADFSLRIPGRPGVSGSPVLIRQGGRYRLLGIVSAFALDSNKNMTSVAFCTAAYRILETLAPRLILVR